MTTRLNITLDKEAMIAIDYLAKEYHKSKSQIISQALLNFQEESYKAKRKALWEQGLKEANTDKEYLKEQEELANAGANDGIA